MATNEKQTEPLLLQTTVEGPLRTWWESRLAKKEKLGESPKAASELRQILLNLKAEEESEKK